MKRSALLPFLLVLTLAVFLPLAGADRSGQATQPDRSERSERSAGVEGARRDRSAAVPPINLSHVFEGEINRRGRPVGFHARPGGRDPRNARVARVLEGPNRLGVYVAAVEIRGHHGDWLDKRSTFYPDRMSRQQVAAAILNAWRRRTTAGAEKFRGPSGLGFTIEGWYQNGRINTAYPIFQ
jgi:hypothetical protein